MRFHQWLNVSVVLFAAVASLAIAKPACAHVILDLPNGGEDLVVGSTYTVQWHIAIAHNLQNWDLWYSTTGATGPWIPIAMNLPPGSGAVGSVHTYNWVIPNAISNQVRVRVRMDNSGTDYEDISNNNLSIISASTHAVVDLPDGGEVLEVGSIYTIQWHIVVAHDLQNWDLWYSTTGAKGPWIPIATDLPPGSGTVGSVHTYDWEIPDDISNQVRVRVRMDNSGTDYEDISNNNLSIIPAIIECIWDLDGNDTISTTDLLILFGNWGPNPGHPADFNKDGFVNTSDLLILFANWGPCP
ncbi:MAG: hypothetical protein IH984_06435 [Planctomycetes bacterium]|nr:hypothetical protein [Planctomycetota bacterium]